MLYTDFSIILEQSKYESMCFKDKKIAEYGYEFNDGDQIWSDTAEIYKTDNDNLFIKKYETGYTNEVKYSAISLNNLIEEIQQFKKDNGKDRRGGCFIIKDLPNEYYKANINSYIKNFCDGTIAVKINSQEELDNLIKLVHEEDKKINCSLSDCNGYNKNFPYYFIREAMLDESRNLLDAVEDMKYLDTRYHSLINGIKHITEYADFKDKTLHNENKLVKNKTQYER